MHKGTKATLSIFALVIAAVAAFPASVSAAHGPTLTITTNTTLSADFTGGIGIAADGITLDCAGHTVMGPGVALIFHPDGEPFVTTGILLEGRTNVTVKNCHVTGFGDGFWLDGSDGNTLQGNTADGNLFGGFGLSASNDNILTDNTANDIAEDDDPGTGFYLGRSFGNTLQNNTANGNRVGFSLEESSLNSLEANTANNNTRVGFQVGFSHENTLKGNAGCDNGDFDAIQDHTSTGNVWRENVFCTPIVFDFTPVAPPPGVSPLLLILIVVAGVGVLVAVVILARRGRSR